MYAASEAPNLVLGEGVTLGEGVQFGANVTIYAGTVIGDGCVIDDGAVLGKRPRLAAHSTASESELGQLELGRNVTVCTGAVVFAGAHIADGVIVGDQAQVRERSSIGVQTVIGRASSVDNDVRVGQRVRIQSGVYLTAYTVVEDDVFIGPGVVTTNDNTMARHGSETALAGPTLRRACRIGAAAVLVPGIEIGEESYVAAAAVVTADVAPRAVVMGVPGRATRTVPERDLLAHWR